MAIRNKNIIKKIKKIGNKNSGDFAFRFFPKSYPIRLRHTFITKNSKGTRRLGEFLAKEIFNSQKKLSDTVIIELIGDLGTGKTTFLQGFAKGLGIKEKILSPTFVLMKKFNISSRKRILKKATFWHIDCYRLKDHRDIKDFGGNEIFSAPGNIIAVEWPKKIAKILPPSTIKLRFFFINQNIRKINLYIPYAIRA